MQNMIIQQQNEKVYSMLLYFYCHKKPFNPTYLIVFTDNEMNNNKKLNNENSVLNYNADPFLMLIKNTKKHE